MKFLILAATILAVVVLERTARFRFRDARFFRDYFTSDLVYLASALGIAAWLTAAYHEPLTAWADANLPIPRIASINLPLWMSVPLAAMLVDLGHFVAHFLMHRSDALWQLHKVHHSSHTVDWLATFRSHVGEQILRNVLGPLFLIVLGFPITVAALGVGVHAAFAVFNHSNTRLNLRMLEAVFITPRLHRMHHVPGVMFQKNFGTVITLWDRIAGTYDRRELDSEEYGVPDEVHTYPQTWGPQFLEPFRRFARFVRVTE